MTSRQTIPTGLALLRERFLAVTRRRVPAESVEDIVQDALRIVIEKGAANLDGDVEGSPAIAWCFQVLRHCIGNHYQREGTRARFHAAEDVGAAVAAPGPTPMEALEQEELGRLVRDALADLARDDSRCGRYLSALAEERSPASLALEEGIPGDSFYRRVYRCRQKLRALLLRRGVFA